MPTTQEIAALLVALGCPPEKSSEMAGQLEKRSHQLAARKSTTAEHALAHLIELMKQGWSAKERGF
jgi:hypothetical protein